MRAMVAGQETSRGRGEGGIVAGIHVIARAEPLGRRGRPAETDCVARSGGRRVENGSRLVGTSSAGDGSKWQRSSAGPWHLWEFARRAEDEHVR